MVNKIDRPGARPDWVVNHTFDLFDKLGATEAQLDFLTSTPRPEWHRDPDLAQAGSDMRPLFEAISSSAGARR